MNGQLYQMARIVSYVRKACETGRDEVFLKREHEWIISYTFDAKLSRSDTDNETINDTTDWCGALRKKGLKRIFLLVQIDHNNPRMAGFANGESQGIVTVYSDGKVSVWIPKWEFDNTRRMWSIYYTERSWDDAPAEGPVFENNIEEFRDVLTRIGEFASGIGAKNYSSIFHDAYLMLKDGGSPEIPKWMKGSLPALEGDALRMFVAASRADVFGGMGSWNDDPGYMAHSMGREEQYTSLSNELYAQIRKAVMYAVNS